MTEQHCEGVSVAHGKARESQERFPHGLECGAGKDFVDHMQNFPVSVILTLGVMDFCVVEAILQIEES